MSFTQYSLSTELLSEHMDSAVILQPVILDLNADNQKDFLFFPADFGEVRTGEPPNLILAVLSDTNGTYMIRNQEIFGNTSPKLGALPGNIKFHDFNEDSRDDIVFATNWHDGRSTASKDENGSQLTVLMSSGEFSFDIINFGLSRWNFNLTPAKIGEKHFLLAGGSSETNGTGNYLYEFSNGEFIKDDSFDTPGNSNHTVIQRINQTLENSLIISDDEPYSELVGGHLPNLIVYYVDENFNLVERSRTVFGERYIEAPVKPWTDDPTVTSKFLEIGSNDYYNFAFDNGFYNYGSFFNDGSDLILAPVDTAVSPTPIIPGEFVEQLVPEIQNLFFKFDGTSLSTVEIDLAHYPKNLNGHLIFEDVNNDGLLDIVTSDIFRRPGFLGTETDNDLQPLIYLNDGNGNFDFARIANVPENVDSRLGKYESEFVLYTDINSDGIHDLVITPNNWSEDSRLNENPGFYIETYLQEMHPIITKRITAELTNLPTDEMSFLNVSSESSLWEVGKTKNTLIFDIDRSASILEFDSQSSDYSNYISSADALDALRLSVGLDTSGGTATAYDFIAADFNRDGKVRASDALEILKYAVGLEAERDAVWVFIRSGYDLSSVNKNNVDYGTNILIEDITSDATIGLTGILIGDVNDSASTLIL